MLIRTIAQAAAFCVVLSGVALAQTTSVQFSGLKADSSLPVELTSDTLEVNQADGTAVFSGNAVATQGELKLSAATLRAEYTEADKAVNTIIATGNVLLVNATDAVQADKAVYTVATAEVVFTGNVLMTQGAAAIASQTMVVDLNTGLGRMSGRVTTTFVPGKKK
ncbi:MAG: LptA/OstA family protein [Cypionkella sp.]